MPPTPCPYANGLDQRLTWLQYSEMSIGLCCVSMPVVSKMVRHHLPAPYKKLRSWLVSRYKVAKPIIPNDCFKRLPRSGRDLLINKSETPRSHDSYLDIEARSIEQLHPDTLLSPYGQGPMKKAVRTLISSGKKKVIDDDGIRFEIELEQHSRHHDSR